MPQQQQQQHQQRQQEQADEKSAKKSKQQEKYKHREKNKKNENKKPSLRTQSSDNSQYIDEGMQQVICGCEAQDSEDTHSCPQWTCRLTKSQQNDASNYSTNAKHDDDDECRISSVLRAFRRSQMSNSSTVPVHRDDGGRLSTDVQHRVNDESTDSEADTDHVGLLQSRTALRDKRMRWNDDYYDGDDNVLVVTRSSTKETNRRTSSDSNSWANYYEDRCSEYNDSDKRDKQPKERS